MRVSYGGCSVPAQSHASILHADRGTVYDNHENARRRRRAETIWQISASGRTVSRVWSQDYPRAGATSHGIGAMAYQGRRMASLEPPHSVPPYYLQTGYADPGTKPTTVRHTYQRRHSSGRPDNRASPRPSLGARQSNLRREPTRCSNPTAVGLWQSCRPC